MKFLSVCSGIEAASVAWRPLGWKAVAFSEIEPFPCALLQHHYPDTPNWGDMTKYKDWPDVSIDLLCGGTPCQSFSVAGLRKGLDDPRGNLMLTYLAIAAKYRPKWLVWENVPGVHSSWSGDDPPSDLVPGERREATETSDFGSFLAGLAELGYGFAYWIFDAQYFGVAQRRRRVFVVGCLGDWRSAAAVLFERHSMQGHPAPSRQARKGIAGGIEIGPSGGSFTDLNPTLDTRAKDGPIRNQLAGAVLHGASQIETLCVAMQVRRLTPRECERLQGFPDDYTDIPVRGKPAADGPRYKALGNSWAVPNVRWLGERIDAVALIHESMRAAA